MELGLIEQLVPELRSELVGKAFEKVYRLGKDELVVRFAEERSVLLLVGIEPRRPQTYLIKRRASELKKQTQPPTQFDIEISRALSGKTVTSVEQVSNERVIEISLNGSSHLLIQLTGKSANVFLLDEERRITMSLRQTSGRHTVGDAYALPKRQAAELDASEFRVDLEDGVSLSAILDKKYQELAESESFVELANAARKKVAAERAKTQRLIKNLQKDLEEHGDPEKWKRCGDLLLANTAAATRHGDKVSVTDYFDPNLAEVEIEADARDTVAEAAKKYFARYARSRNAAKEIATRLKIAGSDLETADACLADVESAIAKHDVEFLQNIVGTRKSETRKSKTEKTKHKYPGVREFVSSDGFEILVGKKAADNDYLTFRIAASRDMWMHAADYPGSHVVIRNPARKELPQRTLIEAAQLAAYNSQAKKLPKAAVHYTEKKFVNKIKGAKPGLVRLASFKTILVEPAMLP